MGEVQTMQPEATGDQQPSGDWFEAIVESHESGIGRNDVDRELFNVTFDAFMSGSYDLAYEGFVKLAEAGSSVSQYYLGMMFLNGKGVLQDFCEAHMWFNIASSRGHDKARKQLEKLTHGMVPEQVAEAQSQARHWVRMQNAGGDLVGK